MLKVGTSGYVYKEWRGILYPDELPQARWLPYYASIFQTVELNTTFYRLPSVQCVKHWREVTPPRFEFVCKGSRYITHMKRLLDPAEALGRYFDRVDHLGDKLGAVLWQLPPQMAKVDLPRLRRFLSHLPTHTRHVFEFRSLEWYREEVCDLLDEFGAGFCEHDLLDRPIPRTTGRLRYLRFHGTTDKYLGRYGTRALRGPAIELTAWARRRPAYAFFNNDRCGHAVWDSLALLELTRRGLPAAAAGVPALQMSSP